MPANQTAECLTCQPFRWSVVGSHEYCDMKRQEHIAKLPGHQVWVREALGQSHTLRLYFTDGQHFDIPLTAEQTREYGAQLKRLSSHRLERWDVHERYAAKEQKA